MRYDFHTLDVFTDRVFGGNPLGVFPDARGMDDATMQRVAREMNLSETAFVAAGEEDWGLRWFTPAVEVDLCGHATLAAAHAIWETQRVGAGSRLRFDTRSGRLGALRRDDWIELDFPARPPREVDAAPGLLDALGARRPLWTGRNDEGDFLLLLEDSRAVRSLDPDMRRLAAIDCRGVIVTAPGDADHDFVSRFFAPAVGVDEDPVTGSAHCCLAPFWSGRLGRAALVGYQASCRGGVVRVEVRDRRVALGGQAVTVMRGRLRC